MAKRLQRMTGEELLVLRVTRHPSCTVEIEAELDRRAAGGSPRATGRLRHEAAMAMVA